MRYGWLVPAGLGALGLVVGFFGAFQPRGALLGAPTQRRYRLGRLPRDMREELFNQHSISVEPEATERGFYAKRVPMGTIDIRELVVAKIPPEQLTRYVGNLPPIVIADGHLIDGQHRILAARTRGETQLDYIDVTGLIDIESMGSISKLPAGAVLSSS